MQTCVRTISLRHPQSNLVRDRCSASRRASGRSKGSRRRCIRCTPPPCPLRTTSFEAKCPSGLLPWPVPPTNFAPVGSRARTTPKDADGSVTPAEGPWQGIDNRPSTEPQTFAFVKIDLGSCYSFVLENCFLHSPYVQAAEHNDDDIICERGDLCRKRASKRDTAQGWICPIILKSSELGLQSEDREEETGGNSAGPTARSRTLPNASRSSAPLPRGCGTSS